MKGASPQLLAIKAILLGYLPYAAILRYSVYISAEVSHEMLWALLYCFIVYTAFAYTYFHLFNMGESARRIRILYEIYLKGALSVSDIETLYRSSEIIRIRLDRLVAMKKLRYAKGYYSLDGKMLYWAALLVKSWRKILQMDVNHAQ